MRKSLKFPWLSTAAISTAAIAIVVVGSSVPAVADDGGSFYVFVGVWDTVTQTPSGPLEGVLTCEVVDGELVITEASIGRATEVSYAENALNFVLDIGGVRYNVVAEVTGDTLDGKVFVGGTSFCNYEEMYEVSGTRRSDGSDDSDESSS